MKWNRPFYSCPYLSLFNSYILCITFTISLFCSLREFLRYLLSFTLRYFTGSLSIIPSLLFYLFIFYLRFLFCFLFNRLNSDYVVTNVIYIFQIYVVSFLSLTVSPIVVVVFYRDDVRWMFFRWSYIFISNWLPFSYVFYTVHLC